MKNIVIIGASSGVGKALVEAYSASDYRVIAIARRIELIPCKSNIFPVAFDVTNQSDIKALMANIVKDYGKINTIAYCAGVQYIAPLRTSKVDKVIDVFNVNFMSAYFFLGSFSSKKIYADENPSFVVISSIAAQKPEPGILAYSASKAAIESLVVGSAIELAPIRVNAVAPGFMETQMTKDFPVVYSEEFIRELDKKTPLGMTLVSDVVKMIEFLSGESATKITGEIISVDGGSRLL